MMRKLLIVSALVTMLVLTGCAFSKLLSGPKVEMFTLSIEDRDIAVQLPLELLKEKIGDLRCSRCYNASPCILCYAYNVNSEPGYEHVNFWYYYVGNTARMVCVCWVSRMADGTEIEVRTWLYKGNKPVLATIVEMNRILNSIYRGEGTP